LFLTLPPRTLTGQHVISLRRVGREQNFELARVRRFFPLSPNFARF
jgi:hypothetical protein